MGMRCSAIISADDWIIVLIYVIAVFTARGRLVSCYWKGCIGGRCKIKPARPLRYLLRWLSRRDVRSLRFLMRLRWALGEWLSIYVCLWLRLLLWILRWWLSRFIQLIFVIWLQSSAAQTCPQPSDVNSWYALARRKFDFWCVYSGRVADHY